MFKKLLDWYTRAIAYLIIVLMAGLLVSVALQILGRYVPFIPRWLWTVEVSRFTLIWVIFLGAMIGVRENRHFYVDFLPENMPKYMNVAVRVIYYLGMYSVTAIFLWFGRRFFMMGFVQRSDITGMNLGFIFVSVPLSGLTWLVFVTESLIREIKGLPKVANAAFPEADEMEDLA